VSAQYEAGNPYIGEDRVRLGVTKLDDASTSDDMHAQAALCQAVDFVVTCQQTLVHVAGAVGAKTLVAVNSKPHWRYHMSGQMPWYKSVSLYRQKVAGEWQPVLKRIADDLHYATRIYNDQKEAVCS
jgi:lysozyme family protein